MQSCRLLIYGDNKSYSEVYEDYESYIMGYIAEKDGWIYTYNDMTPPSEFVCDSVWADNIPACNPMLLVRYKTEWKENDIPSEVLASDVSCFSVRNEKLFYAIVNDSGTEFYMADLDGGNARLIASVDDYSRCTNMVVSDSRLVCVMNTYFATEYGGMDNGVYTLVLNY